MQSPPPQTEQRRDFYRRLAPLHLAPLWEVLRGLITPEPKSACQAAIWHYAQAKAEGAEIVDELETMDYGGSGYSARDPEGHLWSFGDYDPWAEHAA